MMMLTIITLNTAEAVSRCLVKVLAHDMDAAHAELQKVGNACVLDSKFGTCGSTDGCTRN